jgi:hypothetical protein
MAEEIKKSNISLSLNISANSNLYSKVFRSRIRGYLGTVGEINLDKKYHATVPLRWLCRDLWPLLFPFKEPTGSPDSFRMCLRFRARCILIKNLWMLHWGHWHSGFRRAVLWDWKSGEGQNVKSMVFSIFACKYATYWGYIFCCMQAYTRMRGKYGYIYACLKVLSSEF